MSPDAHLPDHLKAIKENSAGLAGIAGERIWVEMGKIMSQRFNFEFIQYVYSLGIWSHIGLPENGLKGRENHFQIINEQGFVNNS